jgi:hypothetical protein
MGKLLLSFSVLVFVVISTASADSIDWKPNTAPKVQKPLDANGQPIQTSNNVVFVQFTGTFTGTNTAGYEVRPQPTQQNPNPAWFLPAQAFPAAGGGYGAYIIPGGAGIYEIRPVVIDKDGKKVAGTEGPTKGVYYYP